METRQTNSPSRSIYAYSVLVALALLVFGLLLYGSLAGSRTNTVTKVENVSGPVTAPDGNGVGMPSTAQTVSATNLLEAFAWSARTRLEDMKLNDRLRVTSTKDNSLRIDGDIYHYEQDRWVAFLHWYGSNPGFPPLINEVREVDLENELPKIKSVWMDHRPTVMFSDGTVAAVGSVLRHGWKLVSISSRSILFEREGVVIALAF